MDRPRENPSPTREIQKHWREEVPGDRLAHLVRDAGRAFTRELQTRLAERGVAFGHWAFLRALWQQDGLTQRELSRKVGVMEPTTNVALKAMESQGWIDRRRCGGNQKNLYVHLTAAGRALEDELVPLAVEVNRVAVSGVPETDQQLARRVLLAIIDNLAAEEAPYSILSDS